MDHLTKLRSITIERLSVHTYPWSGNKAHKLFVIILDLSEYSTITTEAE